MTSEEALKLGWRPIVGAPKDGTQVIVAGPGYAYEAVWVPHTNTWMVLDHDGRSTELAIPPVFYRLMPSSPLP